MTKKSTTFHGLESIYPGNVFAASPTVTFLFVAILARDVSWWTDEKYYYFWPVRFRGGTAELN